MSTAHAEVFVHLVWSTFDRAPWISEEIEKPLYHCVFRSTRALVPVAPEQPFRCTRAPSERSDDPLARGTYLPFTI
jgi:hypothetical protein